MKTQVNFETAILLKTKGFDIRTKGFYNNGIYVNTGSEIGQYHSFHNGEPKTDSPLIALVPTITEVVMWLYEKHGIWISVSHKRHSENKHFAYNIKQANGIEIYLWEHNSPTEAYSEAINYSLKNLIK